jgi:glucose-6-phosphate isomerase
MRVHLSIFHDSTFQGSHQSTESLTAHFTRERILERLHEIDRQSQRDGVGALDSSDPLVAIGTESSTAGVVTKNSYGVLNLAWQAEAHPEWAARILSEIEEIRARIRQTHGTRLRFLIWAGMGGSIEDKSMYSAVGLLKGSPRCYSLDSTDPAKLKCILEDMRRRSGATLPEVLRATLVVGMAMGMTSYEPVVNLEKLTALYEKYRIDSRPNFIYLTLPGSILDQFAGPRGYRKVELQMDGANSTAGRHSAPLTRGSLYPLALAGVDLDAWMRGAVLSADEIHTAWRLSSFIQSQALAGRDKITLALPKPWQGAALWTKQDFEESLGKSEEIGLKIVIGEPIKLANYRAPKDGRQDRAFLVVKYKGKASVEEQKLRRAGYPVAVLAVPAGAPLSRYMQFVHYTVCGLGVLRKMNFVTQPSVELYKVIAGRLYEEARRARGIENTKAWRTMTTSGGATWRGAVTLCDGRPDVAGETAPARYASHLKRLIASGRIDYGELTYFGDLRYCERGRKLRQGLDRAAERLFRSRLKIPVDVYEGPAMNHSYHEMIIGHGKCFTTIILTEKAEQLPAAGYDAQYHRTQFLATKLALEQRGRDVVTILLKDLSDKSLAALDEFFRQAAVQC